jgi:hypothetical protein
MLLSMTALPKLRLRVRTPRVNPEKSNAHVTGSAAKAQAIAQEWGTEDKGFVSGRFYAQHCLVRQCAH